MKIKTREGTTLVISVKWPENEPDGIIFFRYRNGLLCSSRYLTTFQRIVDGDGLTLSGPYLQDKQTLTPTQVTTCKWFIKTRQFLRSTAHNVPEI